MSSSHLYVISKNIRSLFNSAINLIAFSSH
nr:MAG TPA: hypothetical protein [Caudoviricetes sp.]